ncbi:MAG TPA: alpha/beta fold hydrolase [Nocardioidaceae bacterium]|nr:alpha/beta fold hydrolase [Nocardioidaceae bacterium]
MSSPLAPFLCPPGYAGPTGLRALAREGSAVTEAARLVRRAVTDRVRSGEDSPYDVPADEHGEVPVMLIPGFMAGDATLALMAAQLRRLGYRTYRSRMHANVGCTREASDGIEARLEEIVAERGRRVSIVGHSLGGLLARGLAVRRPDLVEAIVTLASPILAPGATHPVLLFDLSVVLRLREAGFGAMMGADCTSGECARLSWERAQAPIAHDVAFTSVFSRRDGLIDWRSCLDPQAKTVEVTTSHIGMAIDPGVMDVVARALSDNRARHARRRPA